jgi:hypothetical protein
VPKLEEMPEFICSVIHKLNCDERRKCYINVLNIKNWGKRINEIIFLNILIYEYFLSRNEME